MNKTKIEWTDVTWNVLRGCSRVSPGCQNCYAEGIAARFSGPGLAFEGLAKRTPSGPRWTGEVRLVEDLLYAPLRWRGSRRVFVNSMSDLFHESVSFENIDRIFGVMNACEFLGRNARPGHTFQILTKRSERMREYMSTDRRAVWGDWAARLGGGEDPDHIHDQVRFRKGPPPHIWLGVSTENQETANARIPHLLETPAAVRFVSAEPLLGPINFDRWFGLHWIIVGGESGPWPRGASVGPRPMHPEWARSIRDQCASAGVPFFFKQWGAYGEIPFDPNNPPSTTETERWLNLAGGHGFHGEQVVRIRRASKASTGRSLDGVMHSEFPVIEATP